jgi:hypothetical protein
LLFKPLSYEAVINRLQEAYDHSLPMFALFYRNTSWVKKQGYTDNVWRVGASIWTKAWMNVGFPEGEECLYIPRRDARLVLGSIAEEAGRRRKALLVHTSDAIASPTPTEVEVIVRPKFYGPDVAQIFVVGVLRSRSSVLAPQIQLLGADERQASFHRLFRPEVP